MGLAERILDDAELARRRRKPLDGGDVVAIGLHREHQAGAHRLAVEPDGAGATDAMLAPGMRAVEQEIFTQAIEQRLARFDVGRAMGAIDPELDFHCAPFTGWPSASARACSSARMQSVMATRRR